jgi:putative MATE family efflux protein
MDARTQRLLQAPITPMLLRLGAPNTLVLLVQAGVGLMETWFVGRLGTAELAGVSLVFPLVMFMQMTSNGAMGGGITSAIARALGSRRTDDANRLVWHALAIAAAFGLLFTAVLLLWGRAIYSLMGGQGSALQAALTYSNWVFAGAVLIWAFNALSACVRGTGNMKLQAWVTVGGALPLIPLSALLIFGWGPIPGLGVAGGALALLIYYAGGLAVMVAYLASRHSLLRPGLRAALGAGHWRRALFWDVLKTGLIGIFSTVATNVAIGFATAMVGRFGSAAIAGYGTGSRLEYLVIPLVFGFGAPLVAVVGTCIGAGLRARALRATWIGVAIAAGLAELVGLAAAIWPRAWLGLFGTDPAMMETGAMYLRTVGPFYGFFGLGIGLYFASQGAGRLLWPIIGNLVRLLVALLGGWLAMAQFQSLQGVFVAQAAGLVAYGCINAWAVWRGAWYGPILRRSKGPA